MQEILEYNIGGYTVAKLLSAVAIFIVCLIVVKILMKILGRALAHSRLDTGVRSFSLSLVRILLYFLAVVIVCGSLGIPVSSLLAVLSIAGLAASLAMQDTLSNLASGIMILATHPFKVGDFVECGGSSGTVKDIALAYTSILTIDNRVVFIPNKDIAAARVTNFSTEPLRRIDLSFSASYDSPTADVKAALLSAAARVPTALAEPEAFAAISAYKNSCIEYVLRVWSKTADYWDTYFGLMEQVRECFAEHGVQMTYEHVNVHIIDK